MKNKIGKKRARIRVIDQKKQILAELGGNPLPQPLTENHFAKKSLTDLV